SPQPSASQIRLKKVIACLTGVVATLEALSQAFHTPFLEAISKTSASLLMAVQTIKQNKGDCAQLMEQTTGLLYAVVSIHVRSTPGSDLPASMLNHLGKFTETLHKIHGYVEAQQDKSNIRQFFRQGELATLLKACNAGLQEALQAFKLQNVHLLTDLSDIHEEAESRHEEVLQLIDAYSDSSISDRAPSRMFSVFHNSSTSISMLPSEPKIFHGRETELSDILKLFIRTTPRIAILGPGGIGKTSLARAILHAPQVADKFEQRRFFVACDSASTKAELVCLVGAHLELKPGKDLTQAITQFLSSLPAGLLILDNMETPWEPIESREDIEEFLSVLTDIPQLGLIITMRGAERPAKVQWTRPFFPSLQPLTQNAARHTFIDIADDKHDPKEIDQVLLLTDNVPLAIDLIAHLVDSEDCSSVLSRWDREKNVHDLGRGR
ncbi:P-loop containing nucleoside triphosphate hydrolase protein, partial [Mycena crocata]